MLHERPAHASCQVVNKCGRSTDYAAGPRAHLILRSFTLYDVKSYLALRCPPT